MKFILFLGSMLIITHPLCAAPISLEGNSVRFILDDKQLTAFGGETPLLQGDTLIFSPPVDKYHAETDAPQTPVDFASDNIEFKVEALPGHNLHMITLHTSGLRSEEGEPLLSKTLAYGELNVKDQFFVSTYFKFESEDASTGSWQGVNVSTDSPEIVGIMDLTTRTLDVSFSHNMRALALNDTGSASIDAQDGVSFKIKTTIAEQHTRVFNWAERKFNLKWGTETLTLKGSSTFQCNQSGSSCKNLDGLFYRCYTSARLCIGSKSGVAYIYNLDERIIHKIGSIQPYFAQTESDGF